ncbi:Serine protease trypsin-like protein [Phytophthora megakarya]|uniref:Serine protease trypsin-like protein n=1 Tax=Phytophthora megakarya TaxID=4795 RepID=A0A225WHM1_9STRA|nr:Serine protease trypsin-like protein [Phytophthora megakarya]
MLAPLVHCFSFAELSTDLTTDEENRIYGGSNADMAKNLYVASLHDNGTDSQPFCGGTLIAPEFILTAGHCLEARMYDVYASLGSKYSMGGGSRKSEMTRVVRAFRHPSYDLSEGTITRDVALLKLETRSTIKPAILADADGSDDKPGRMATVLGWGLINNETFSDILQAVDVEVITNAKCVELGLANITSIDESVICAGIEKGKDACGGDSGGPLLVNGVLVGVVSSGSGTCGTTPGTYARVSYVMDFINDVLAGKSIGDISELLTAGYSRLEQ